MADTTTLESVAPQTQGNGNGIAAPTKPSAESTNPGDASAGEVADDELSEVPKTKLTARDEGDQGDVVGEADEYDFEVSAQVSFTSATRGLRAVFNVQRRQHAFEDV